MNLVLFQTHRGNAYPVTETPPSYNVPLSENSGRWSRIKAGVHRTYERLKQKLDYQERLCSQLRSTVELRVYHPPSMAEGEAREKLQDFMRRRSRKHGRWLWIDAALAFCGIFFMPIPGPNFFFFYPAARTLGHYFARKGAKHVLSLNSVSFQTDETLDRVQNHEQSLENLQDVLNQLERRYNLQELEPHLARLRDR